MRRLKIVAVQCVIGFLTFELLLRLYSPIPFRLRGDTIVLPTNQVYLFDTSGTRKLDAQVVHHKNALGFRGPNVPPDFAERLTLVTIGGSTTECLFLSDGKTWTDVLGQLLERDRGDTWTNNAGLDGHSTYGHLILLDDYISKLKPKVAIFLIGTNDVGLEQSTTFDNAARGERLPTMKTLEAWLFDHSAAASFGLNLYRAAAAKRRGFGHSELDLTNVEVRGIGQAAIDEQLQQHREAYIPGFSDRVRAIVATSRRYGIEPVLITQPALFGNEVDPATGVNVAMVKVNGRGNGRSEWQLLELYNDATRRVAAEQGALLIDLGRELPKDSRYFYDWLHFTNDGAREVAGIAFRHLAPHLQQRYPAARR